MSRVAVGAQTVAVGAPRSRRLLHLLASQPVGMVSAAVLAVFILVALLSPVLVTHDPLTRVDRALLSPDVSHWLGTDNLGRDVYSRTIRGARISVTVAFLVVALNISIGTFIGLVSAYYGRWLDQVVQRMIDVILTIPQLLLLMVIVSVLSPSLINVVVALTIGGLPRTIRVVRSVVLSERQKDYVTAAISMGSSDMRILLRHVAPQTLTPVLVVASFILPQSIIAEASLSFLGLGVPPPEPSWGQMISEGRRFLVAGPWMTLAPAVVLALIVFAGNMVGDMLREVWDPRMRGRG